MRNNSSLVFPPINVPSYAGSGTQSIDAIDKQMTAREIEDLITKVTMNSAFLNLAKNDE